jgi:hypothetical protein
MGKGGNTTAPPAPDAVDRWGKEPKDQVEDIDMLSMFSSMMQMMQAVPAAPALPATPSVFRAPQVDWTEKNKQLASRASADYKTSTSKKKGRSSTILTKPLLDDTEPSTTSSLLTG